MPRRGQVGVVDDVLQADWHSVQGPAPFAGDDLLLGASGSGERDFGRQADVGVQARVEPFGAPDQGLGVLDRRQPLRPVLFPSPPRVRERPPPPSPPRPGARLLMPGPAPLPGPAPGPPPAPQAALPFPNSPRWLSSRPPRAPPRPRRAAARRFFFCPSFFPRGRGPPLSAAVFFFLFRPSIGARPYPAKK